MSHASVRAYLAAHAPDLPIIEVASSTATVALAAQALGVAPGRIAKTLALRIAGEVVLLVTRGDARLNNAKTRTEFGARPRMLDPEETLAVTGHPVGGVCPFGLATPVPVYCDVSLRAFDEIFPAAGSLSTSVRVTPERLGELVAARWVDVCRTPACARVFCSIAELPRGSRYSLCCPAARSGNKDLGAWQIPKGMIECHEEPLAGALREFEEEIGMLPPGVPQSLGVIRQAGGKRVEAFALEGDVDPALVVSNRFDLEWPPKSGVIQAFPEVERAAWFSQLIELVRQRIARTEAQLAELGPLREQMLPNLTGGADYLFEHIEQQRQADRRWLGKLIKALEIGEVSGVATSD